MRLKIGDLVRANEAAQTYYTSDDFPEDFNSDWQRRSLELGVVTQVSPSTGVGVTDLVRGFELIFADGMLKVLTYEITEPLFDFPAPTYRHF